MRILIWIVVAATLGYSVADASAADLFWNDDNGIHRNQNADPPAPKPLFETFETRGISIDVENDRLIWSDVLPIAGPGPGGVIRAGSSQGGGEENVAAQLPSPSGVAIDAGRRRIYWTDLGDANNPSAVYSANLDGSDARQIISAAWLSEIAGIAIDPARDQLYFSFVNPLLDSLFTGGIARADLDGANAQPVIGGLGKPLGLAIDSSGGEVYWADAGLSEGMGAIQAGDLDGQQRRTILGGLGLPFGVALDLAEQNVYWTDQRAGKIGRTSMPGVLPFFEDVITELSSPTAIAIQSDPQAGPSWKVDSDGKWSNASNWEPRVPNGPGEQAFFGGSITAPRTVTVDGAIRLGRIDFDNANAFTIAARENTDESITLDAKKGDALIQVHQGSHTISAPVILADNAVITVFDPAGELTITRSLGSRDRNLTKGGAGTLTADGIRAAALAVNGGTLVLRGAAGANDVASVIGQLALAGNASSPFATLDISASALVIDYPTSESDPATIVRQQILAGRGGPGFGQTWNGTGITSSQARADANDNPESTSVAYADNAALPLGTYNSFRGQTVDKTAVFITYTRTGDANLDGMVDNDDVTIVGANYAPGVSKPAWALGDFDYNGFVDDDDVTLLGAFYDPEAAPLAARESAAPGAVAAVPEPSTLVLLNVMLAAIAVVAVQRDCKRRRMAA